MSFYNEKIYSPVVVWQRLNSSSTFGWSRAIDTQEYLGHTVIVLNFDDTACYTMNLASVDGICTRSAITIEDAEKPRYTFFPIVESIDVTTPEGKERARKCILDKLPYVLEHYNLIVSNCHEHYSGKVQEFHGIYRNKDKISAGWSVFFKVGVIIAGALIVSRFWK